MNDQRIRLSLDLTQRLRGRLEEIRDQTEVESLAAVVRNAINLYSHIIDTHSKGACLVIEHCDDSPNELLVLTEMPR